MRWGIGQSAIEYLLSRGHLERVSDSEPDAREIAARLSRAKKRLTTAHSALSGGDFGGALTNAYDAYRMSADCLLAQQGLRATTSGGHVAVETAVCTQFKEEIPCFNHPTFEQFRNARHPLRQHREEYFDPMTSDVSAEDAKWAIETAELAPDGVRALIASNRLFAFTETQT